MLGGKGGAVVPGDGSAAGDECASVKPHEYRGWLIEVCGADYVEGEAVLALRKVVVSQHIAETGWVLRRYCCRSARLAHARPAGMRRRGAKA